MKPKDDKFAQDEIYVLGSSRQTAKKTSRKWLCIIATVVVLLIIALYLVSQCNRQNGEMQFVKNSRINTAIENSANAVLPEPVYVEKITDSINEVALNIYALNGLYAELQTGLPDIGDTTICFVVQAADVRKDNGQILGDFVINGVCISKGKSKTGYCAIVDGNISLGTSSEDAEMNYCIDRKGSFFRQYPLVLNGEICGTTLKGKSRRNALAIRNSQLYIVHSVDRESLYDFAEALSDYGFTTALYLIGGTSYGWYQTVGKTVEFGEKQENSTGNVNYLIFRKVKNGRE